MASGTSRPTAAVPPVQTDRRRNRRRKERLLAAGLLAPSMLIFGVFVFYPFARNIYLSLYTTPPFPNMPSRFVGLSQYGQVLGSHNFLNTRKSSSLRSTVLPFHSRTILSSIETR